MPASRKIDFAIAATSTNVIEREKTILEHATLVQTVARRLLQRVPPCVTIDDLVGAGTVGLIQAVDRYDSRRGTVLRAYAQHRILGAMLDYLRTHDPRSRAARSRIRKTEAPTLQAWVAVDDISENLLARLFAAYSTQPDVTAHVDLEAARASLSHRENYTLTLLYDRDWNAKEVAQVLGVNESRVSQIRHRALRKLRAYFGIRRLVGSA